MPATQADIQKYLGEQNKIFDYSFPIQKFYDELLNIAFQTYEETVIKSNGLDMKAKSKLVAENSLKMQDAFKKFFDENPSYQKELSKFLTNFDKLNVLNVEGFKTINNLSVKEAMKSMTPQQNFLRDNTLTNLQSKGMYQSFIEPMTQILNSNALLGTSIKDAKKYMKDYIAGDPKSTPKMKQYADQVVQDGLHQYDGQIKGLIANEFELDCILYVGSLITDSRAQCARWHDKETLKVSELQKEIDWAYKNGSGMIPGTTPANFLENRGGFRCRHMAIPFRCD